MSSYYNKKPLHRIYPRENKYDKSFPSSEPLHPHVSFQTPENLQQQHQPPSSNTLNKNATPYYPLPSNEGYEMFLKTMKKNQYIKTQYSLPFMLSLKDKYTERPQNMKEIKIPQKNEIRSRAKIVTEEAYRVTRNYLNENTDKRNFSIAYISKNELTQEQINQKTKLIREILNKICMENYDAFLNQILKFEYDEKLLDIFKTLILTKTLTEKKYFALYVNILIQMCKLYNKKTYSNEPKMNMKSLLLISIQKEFLNTETTNITTPFELNNTEQNEFVHSIKIQNMKLICELYLNSVIPKKVISDCVNELIKKTDSLSIMLLCDLIKATYKKIFTDEKELLETALGYLEQLYYKNKDTNKLNSQIKSKIMDIFDLKEKIINVDYLKKEESNLSYNYNNLSAFPIGGATWKSSEARSRKSSINPKDVEYIRRSRFNSRADELKGQKDSNPSIIDELVTYLGADLEFYQCFLLTEEEFDIIKEGASKLLGKLSSNNNGSSSSNSNVSDLINDFNIMMEEVQCEKFIVVGHLLKIMFSLNEEDANLIKKLIVFLYENKMIDDDDIKHGLVLGLVNYKDNIIDYPNTKDYFRSFVNCIKDKNILDEKMITVFQRTCDNLDKCYE